MAKKIKEVTKGYNPDNELGWTEEEFVLMQCRMICTKMRNNIKLTPAETRLWCNWGDDFQNGRLEEKINNAIGEKNNGN